jgi:hypothetical protein
MSCGRLQRSSSIDSMVEAAAWGGDQSPMGPLSPSASPCSSHSGPAATRQRVASPLMMMAPPRLLLLSPSVGRRTKFDSFGASGQSTFPCGAQCIEQLLLCIVWYIVIFTRCAHLSDMSAEHTILCTNLQMW